MEVQRRLMVVGALPGNLGGRVYEEAKKSHEWAAIRAYDVVGGPSYYLDLLKRREVVEVLETFSPTDIVCTVGINRPEDDLEDLMLSIMTHSNANVAGPMQLLAEAMDLWRSDRWIEEKAIPATGFNFCAVSSNSAHIARSQSAGYCSSKAALSMALRCVARREASSGVKIWGYEPGFLSGTPMSLETMETFGEDNLHRIPGGMAIDPDDIADRIVGDLIVASRTLNGCMIRLDGGEQ
jgi:NAD(P)-dependent dehydrogenase (short-subunit alcohol dehydrogenase family)